MDFWKNITEIWKSLKQYPFGVAFLFLLLILIVTFLWGNLPKFLDWLKAGRDKYKEYRENLLNKMELSYKEYIAESIFFDDSLDNRKYHYFRRKNVLLNESNKNVRFFTRKEFLLTAGPGTGKSSFMKHLFLCKNRPIRRLLTNSIGLYFDYNATLLLLNKESDEQKKSLIENLKSAGYRKYYLFFDGIDELGVDRLAAFFSLVQLLRNSQRRIRIVISTRDKFLKENRDSFTMGTKILRKFHLSEWTSDSIKKYALYLLKNINLQSDKQALKDIQAKVENNCTNPLLGNPLSMKMYLYALLNNPTVPSKKELNPLDYPDNRYSLYEIFVKSLFFNSHKQNYNEKTFQNKMNKLSEACFIAYESDDRTVAHDDFDPVALFKPNGTLIHETFFEFFVAKYYFSTFTGSIENITLQQLKSLTHDYSNEYADFISSAIAQLGNEDKEIFLKNLCTIYYHALKEPLRAKFASLAGIVDSINPRLNEYVNIDLQGEGELLTLKNQIIFRFGRVQYDSDTPNLGEILAFIYYNDDETRCHDDIKFFTALLKRGCAISSSFIGHEGIELDYVKHILSYRQETYDIAYDLANRSHTMVFYGDVKVHRDIMQFRDENPVIPCTNALNKRINRLAKNLPETISVMDNKQLKTYYFRLFDLATIYSFLSSRKISLSDKQRSIIRNCSVVFKGQSTERKELMIEIKRELINLISA